MTTTSTVYWSDDSGPCRFYVDFLCKMFNFRANLNQYLNQLSRTSLYYTVLQVYWSMRQGLCYGTVSVRLSVCPICPLHQRATGLLLWVPPADNCDRLLHGASAQRGRLSIHIHSSKCEQCHVYSDVGSSTQTLCVFFKKTTIRIHSLASWRFL